MGVDFIGAGDANFEGMHWIYEITHKEGLHLYKSKINWLAFMS